MVSENSFLKFKFSTQRNGFSVISFSYFESTTTCIQISKTIKQKDYAWIIKSDVEFWLKLEFCLHISVGIYKDMFSFVYRLCNTNAFNTKLKLLVILVIILLFGFGSQGPMGLM